MEVSLYQAAAAMNATERWQELISDNLASSSIPGSRKKEISFSAVQAGLASQGGDPSRPGGFITAAHTVTNFQQGEMHHSGNNMDMALEGDGFFSIEMPNSETAYTRDGEFQLNSKSQLVNNMGFPVLGDSGPIQFNPGNPAPVTISATGEISQGTEKKGKLKIAAFNDPGLLSEMGGGLFRADSAEVQPKDATDTHVRQGFVENANTSPVTEMSGLFTAMRMFEANQKVIQMQSDRMSREITDLGNPS